jgi:ABC-type antimicrobial peptide transport system permease subunit
VSQVLRVAWYRFRATFRDRWGGYLTIVLLVGLLGGLAMGAMAGARRTQSSFPTLMARANTSTLVALSGVDNPAIGQTNGYNPALERTIAQLPYVKVVKSVAQINLLPLDAKGEPVAAAEGYSFNGSVNGEEFTQDRIIITDGRMANPRRANEFVLDSATARHFGFHLGQVVTFWAYSNAQGAKLATLNLSQVTKELKPFLRIKVKLVGVGAISPSNLMQDDVDARNSTIDLFTPALSDQLLKCCVNTTLSFLQLNGGTAHESAVETEISKVLPKGLPSEFTQLSGVIAKAEQTIKPESIALGVFGVMALLALLVIAGQLIGRRLRLNAADIQVLRALGAEPAMTILDGLIGIVAAVLVGSLLAGLVAIGLSPLALLGPARPYLPHGVNFDWTVLGIGLALIVLSLGFVAVAVAIRLTTRRAAPWRDRASHRGSRAATAAASANLPVSAVTGIRFAMEPGTGRNTVPVRSAIIGSVFAVVIVTATVIFGASLQTLVAKPALYGWNWTYELNGGDGLGDIPAAGAATMLNRDPYVQAWSGVYFGSLQIDGQGVAVLGASPRAAVGPPLLSGHAFNAPNEVVLGAATLAQLHKKLGDTVEVGAAGAPTTRLKIVGTATLPTIGVGGLTHLEMGSGAVLSYALIPAGERNLYDVPPGPNAVLVRAKPGANHAATLSSLNTILDKLGAQACCGAQVNGVQRPAQIINYGSLGSTPAVLGGALAAGAVVALGLTLIASVRRRRRDLALLKILGFTHGQLAAAIAWQSSVAVGIGTIVGVPLGIITGHFLWDLFAREINAVPQPTVPVLSVVLIVVGGLVLANVVAAIPGRIAARTPTALLLRAE